MRSFACFSDPLFWIALLLGPVAWVLLWSVLNQPITLAAGVTLVSLLSVILLYPVLEEIVFRGALQGWLLERVPGKLILPWLTKANLLTSVIFTGFHFIYHSPLSASLVFLPSLVFGWARDRYTLLTGSIVLHVFYNAGYFLLFG